MYSVRRGTIQYRTVCTVGLHSVHDALQEGARGWLFKRFTRALLEKKESG
jgi:hypothetical protein